MFAMHVPNLIPYYMAGNEIPLWAVAVEEEGVLVEEVTHFVVGNVVVVVNNFVVGNIALMRWVDNSEYNIVFDVAYNTSAVRLYKARSLDDYHCRGNLDYPSEILDIAAAAAVVVVVVVVARYELLSKQGTHGMYRKY